MGHEQKFAKTFDSYLASQCFAVSQRGTRGKVKREEGKEWVRKEEIGDNSFHCSSKRGFSYDVCNILTGNQCILIEFSISFLLTSLSPWSPVIQQKSAKHHVQSKTTLITAHLR